MNKTVSPEKPRLYRRGNLWFCSSKLATAAQKSIEAAFNEWKNLNLTGK